MTQNANLPQVADPMSPEDRPETAQNLFEELLSKLSDASSQDLLLVHRAYELASESHQGQLRKSGEPYITHPLIVSNILAELECDVSTICAGLLHDTLEDTDVNADLIRNTFGEDVLKIVEGVTKLSKLSFSSKREVQAENFRKMFLAIASDLRVVLVKLADRLHNMRTLDHMSPAKQKEIAQETLDIFAPLANRFGLGTFKWQLEDLSFKYLNNVEYRRIESIVQGNRSERESLLKQTIAAIKERLQQVGIKAEVKGRVKHFYSIYTKIQRMNSDEIFDLLAVRIIVEREKQCYEVLGEIHDLFKPIPGRFKDYIALPKSNMYQSLHTTIVGFNQKTIEIQIRTYEMHRIAEFGVAAHWKYKEAAKIQAAKDGSSASTIYDAQLNMLRQRMLEMQDILPDAGDYKNAVQIDIFADEIFVFSPKGDVFCLPKGSTPIDFAYYIHSKVGDHCLGARVNQRLVPLTYTLKSGDIVEIQTGKNAHPSMDWLSIVVSSSAKSKIKHWFKRHRRAEYAAQGLELLSNALGKNQLDALIKNHSIASIVGKFGLAADEDLYVALASSDVSLAQVIGRLKNEGYLSDLQAPEDQQDVLRGRIKKAKASTGSVQSLKNLLHGFAKCCQPIPGESILGVISRGRGILIHREDCINLRNIDEKRLLSVDWGEKSSGQAFATTLEVECLDRIGISRDVLDKIADAKINILDVRVMTRPTRHTALVRVSLEVPHIDTLDTLVATIRRLSDVIEIRRYTFR